MPQLVKGGKYIFGWTVIGKNFNVRIPDETYEEYKLDKTDKLILMSGSNASGTLIVNTPDSILHSKFGDRILQAVRYNREQDAFNINKLEIVMLGKRLLSWTSLDKEKCFQLSDTLIEKMKFYKGQRLLVGRGSGVGPAFLSKGKIYQEALKHNNIKEFISQH